MSAGQDVKDVAATAARRLHEAAHCRCTADSLAAVGDATGALLERAHARRLEGESERTLAQPIGAEVVRGPGGEVCLDEGPVGGGPQVGWYLKDTLENPNLINAVASRNRMELALEVSAGCLNSALDAAETIEARDALERMAAHQMAAAHEAAMKAIALGVKTMEEVARSGRKAHVEGCRLLNTATRLMGAYSATLATLTRVRSGGRQEVVVQHVTISGSGPAVVAASVAAGAPKPPGGQEDR